MKAAQANIILKRVLPRMTSATWAVYETLCTPAKLKLTGTKDAQDVTKQEAIYLANNIPQCLPHARCKYIEQYSNLGRDWGFMLQVFKRIIVDACPLSSKALGTKFPNHEDSAGRWFDVECVGSRFRIYDGAHNIYTYTELYDYE